MKSIALILFLIMGACSTRSKNMSPVSPDFLKLWNFSNPEETRTKFLAEAKNTALTDSERLQLHTQIARTYSLQGKFDKAHSELDVIERKMKSFPAAQVRYYLERGRSYNSDNKKDLAKHQFLKAWQLGNEYKLDALAVDAAHMMAIAEKLPEKQLEWNETALRLAENSKDSIAQNWKGSLYNNIGWTYHDKKEYVKALDFFQRGVKFRETQGNSNALNIAKWTVARAYRSLKKYDLALGIQLKLRKLNQELGRPDGYNLEELAELYLVMEQDSKAKPFFAKAYKELSKDRWLVKNEPERLNRMKTLSQ